MLLYVQTHIVTSQPYNNLLASSKLFRATSKGQHRTESKSDFTLPPFMSTSVHYA